MQPADTRKQGINQFDIHNAVLNGGRQIQNPARSKLLIREPLFIALFFLVLDRKHHYRVGFPAIPVQRCIPAVAKIDDQFSQPFSSRNRSACSRHVQIFKRRKNRIDCLLRNHGIPLGEKGMEPWQIISCPPREPYLWHSASLAEGSFFSFFAQERASSRVM